MQLAYAECTAICAKGAAQACHEYSACLWEPELGLQRAHKVPTQHDRQVCPQALPEARLPKSGCNRSSSPIYFSAPRRQR